MSRSSSHSSGLLSSWSCSSLSSPLGDVGRELPFKLPVLQRGPYGVQQQKYFLQEHGPGGAGRECTDTDIDKEIMMKLHYLEKIQELRQLGRCRKSWERKTLLQGLEDRAQQLEQASRLADQVLETVAGLNSTVREEEATKFALQRVLEEKRNCHQKSLAYIKAKLVESEHHAENLQLLDVLVSRQDEQVEEILCKKQTSKGALVTGSGCIQFSNLFALSGQLAEFCHGEHGSKLVVERLENGAQPERGLVREELGLPGSLTWHLASPHCREVIRTLMQVDSTARQQLLRQVKEDISTILAIDGGEDFVKEIVED